MHYVWSAESDLSTLTHNVTGTSNDVTFTDTFTPAHQLASATISNALFRFAPGAVGTSSYGAVNNLNQYPNVTPAGGSLQTLSYDTNGNLTGDGTWTYAYDPENRLMTANKSGTAASYAYDPLGRRSAKTVNSTATYFLSDGDDEIAEYAASGTLLRRFVPGNAIDEPIAMIDYTIVGSPKTFFHKDKMGSVIAMTDALGNLAEGPYVYDAYGNGPPTTGVPYKFTGRRLDPETGLYYYRARYYSASLGRFLQTDPVGYGDQMNMYAYVSNDPVNLIDPFGEIETVTVTASPFTQAMWDVSIGIEIAGLGPEDPAADLLAAPFATIGSASYLYDIISQNPAQINANKPSDAEREKLRAAGKALDRNGLTKAGRSLQKKTGRPGSNFSPPSNKSANGWNQQGAKALDEILNNPNTKWSQSARGQWTATASDGSAAQWNADGSFQGFREP